MTRETWGVALIVIALLLTATGVYAGLAQGDHSGGALAILGGVLALLVGAALVRK